MNVDLSDHTVLTFFGGEDYAGSWKFIRKLPIPRWSGLATIGKSKLVTSLWFWAILTPIAARLIASAPETIDIPLSDATLTLDLKLPFSWIAFYFAALSTAGGQLLYSFRCPSIIRHYPTWASVPSTAIAMEVAQSFAELTAKPKFYLSNLRHKPSEEVVYELWGHFGGEEGIYNIKQDQLSDLNSATERLRTLLTSDSKTLNLLSIGRIYGDVNRFWSRLACTILYSIGLTLFFIVLCQNVAWVISCLSPQ